MTIAGSSAFAAEPTAGQRTVTWSNAHFPAGALDGVDAAVKQEGEREQQISGVAWEKSYANVNKTKTYCVYDAPSENAVREAAKLNGLPVDVRHRDSRGSEGRAARRRAADRGRAISAIWCGVRVRPNVRGDSDASFGVTLLTSYGTADKQHVLGVRGAELRGDRKRGARRAARRSSRSRKFPRRSIRTEVFE